MNKSQHAVHQVISALLLMVFVIQPTLFALPARAARPTQPNQETIYAPFVSAGSSSEIIINSPKANSLVAGSFIFSAQPLNSGGVNSVDFFAGNALLETDTSPNIRPDGLPENGFSIDLDSSEIPNGQVTLRAVAHGTRAMTAQVTVTNVRNPAQQTTANQSGAAVAASEIGSAIMVPPGGLLPGAAMTVTEKGVDEISSEFGIQWEELGVTFLGAQVVETSAPLEKPPAVSSAGFAPQVQPNQAVVNYNLAPDADGDGVAEIVVVNTARVANGNVVSDPLPEVTVGAVTVAGVAQGLAYAAQAGLHGAPGTILEFEVTEFNLYSPLGNVASFKSAVDGKEYRVPGILTPDAGEPSRQRFSTLIPLLPPGAATLTLVNLSTMDTSGPIAITVDAGPALEIPPIEIIDDALAMSIEHINSILPEYDNFEPELNKMAALYSELRSAFQTLNSDPSPAAQQVLDDMAKLILGSGIQEQLAVAVAPVSETAGGLWPVHPASIDAIHCITPTEDQTLHALTTALSLGTGLACAFAITGVAAPVCAAAAAALFIFDTVVIDTRPLCPPPPPCRPGGGGSGITGMGSAPPPGGNLCGGGVGGGNRSLAATASTASTFEQEMGRIKVVVISNGARIPFTGSTDRGGYFFLPLVPEDEPFTAYAIDTVTGQVRSQSGIGPKTGESLQVWFDFATGPNEALENHWTGAGDGVTWQDAQNWSLGRVPGAIDKVIIDVPANPTIIFNGSAQINSLQSAEALTLAGGFLQIGSPSSITGTFTVQGGEHTIDSSLTLNGLLEWTGGTLGGDGLLTLNGGALLSGTPNKRLIGLTVENNANFVFGGTGAITGGRGAIFNNRSGATFELASAALYDGFNLGGAGTIFNNYGTLRKSGAGPSLMDFVFNNHDALVEVQAGTLELRHGGHLQDGTYTVGAGAFFDLAGAPFYTMTGMLDGSGAGQMRGVGATLTTSETATLNFPNGGFGLTAGGFVGSGTFTLQGNFLLSGTAHKIINGVTLNNEAFFQLAGTGDILGGRSAIFNNMSGATFEVASDASYLGIDQGGLDTTFNNSGTLRKRGAGKSVFDLTFNNQGALVEVQADTLELLRGGSLVSGTYTVADGAFLDFTGNNAYSVTGTLTGSGAGEVRLAGGIFKPNASATINFTGGFAMTAGTLQGPGTLTFQGIVTLSGNAAKNITGITINNEALWTWIGPGNILGGGAAIFNNHPGATFDARTNGANITYIGNQSGGGDTTFTNNGAVIKSGDGFMATLDLCYEGDPPVGVNVVDTCP